MYCCIIYSSMNKLKLIVKRNREILINNVFHIYIISNKYMRHLKSKLAESD